MTLRESRQDLDLLRVLNRVREFLVVHLRPPHRPHRREGAHNLRLVVRAGDVPCHGGGHHDFRTGQVGLGVPGAHPPLEVTVRGADPHLTRFQEPRPEANARPAPGGEGLGAGLEEGPPRARRLRGLLNLGACRCHVEVDPRSNPLAPDDPGGGFQVLQAAVHAGNEIGLLDGHPFRLHLGSGVHDLHRVRSGDVGAHLIQLKADAGGVDCPRIRQGRIRLPPGEVVVVDSPNTPGLEMALAPPQIVKGHLVRREPPCQRTPFGGHVGDREPFVHGQAGHPRSGELHHRVQDLALVVEPA